MLKKINFFYLMTLLVLFSSCGKDNDGTAAADIQGDWDLISYTYTGTSTTTVGGQSFSSDFTGEAKNMDWTIDMKSNNKFVSSGDMTIVITMDIAGQPFEFDQPFADWLGTGDYSIVDDKITFKSENAAETTVCDVVELTSNTLKMGCPVTITSTQQGAVSTSVLAASITLEK